LTKTSFCAKLDRYKIQSDKKGGIYEKDFSAQKGEEKKESWIFEKDGDKGGQKCASQKTTKR